MRLEYSVNVGDYTRHRDSKNPKLKSPCMKPCNILIIL
jgi:hypothetical protein